MAERTKETWEIENAVENEFVNAAKGSAWKTLLVDTAGDPITGANPLPTTGGGSGGGNVGILDASNVRINPAKEDGHLSSLDTKIIACNTGAVAGSVTANAGTNLNTSTLALEAGGNLATIAGKDFATETTLGTIALEAGGNLETLAGKDFATSTAQTDGSQVTQIADGSGNIISATANALDVNVTNVLTYTPVENTDADNSVQVLPANSWEQVTIPANCKLMRLRLRDKSKEFYFIWDSGTPSGTSTIMPVFAGEAFPFDNPASLSIGGKNLFVYSPSASGELCIYTETR